MSDRRSFRFRQTEGPWDATVAVDGVDITDSVHGVTLTASARHPGPTVPIVMLDVDERRQAFLADEVDVEVGAADVRVAVSDLMRDLLVRMGWTPPAEVVVATEG